MEDKYVIKALAALAQPNRLQIFRSLVVKGSEGLTPALMAEALGMPANTLSFHLKELMHADLISQERSGRHLIYRAQYDRMNAVLAYLSQNCCQGQACELIPDDICKAVNSRKFKVTDIKPLNVLFLCTHNSARSILAEALLNHVGHGKFKAYSAGSSPRENQKPNPMAIATLQKAGIATEELSSKSWDVFAVPDAPHMDLVITVCDNAAGEVCPYWPGQPATAHWGYADPSEAAGGDAEKLEAFLQTLHLIKKRLEIFTSLPIGTLSKMALQNSVRELAIK